MAEPAVRPRLANNHSSDNGGAAQSGPQIAHTLTACCRCRTRKTRCDPGLPRCTPCERAGSICEYYDQSKGRRVQRNYVVHLQHKVRELEHRLAQVEKEDGEPDAEDVLRGGATVRLQEHDESKFLGPSSGIAITRLVMNLAKQFTDSTSISQIVSENRALDIKNRFDEEGDKPTSKVYPLISDVAAAELLDRNLTDLLVQLFLSKVIAMYPFLHEQTLMQDVEDVYNGSTDPFQNFAVRMVIAVSLQRMDTQYAGLADSFYLAALKYLEDTVKLMSVKTIQCFCFFAVYSLLTPTRTAVYYVVGLAGRLAQALGLCEEKSIVQGPNGTLANPLEIDMRRRVYWCAMVMEFGLAHSLGRPSCFPMAVDHMDVAFYQPVDDTYITKDGVTPGAPFSLKKWISIHFFKMRVLQLEIRRKLYQTKRAEPKDDSDPWFVQMEEKLNNWRNATPEGDADSGLNKVWFIGRHNTMRVFLFRPSPQVPRPSVRAARECYDACQYNIYMHKQQIESRSVELTWIFTQSIFMTINTILWSLSYSEIRKEHPRDEVKGHLDVALWCIYQASHRWPGVTSARELYQPLIEACFKIYDKDGDVNITAGSPTDSSGDGSHRSTTTSPAVQYRSLSENPQITEPTPPDATPFGYVVPQPQPQFRPSPSPHNSLDYSAARTPSTFSTSLQTPPNPTLDYTGGTPNSQSRPSIEQRISESSFGKMSNLSFDDSFADASFDPSHQFNRLPEGFDDMAVNWNPTFNFSTQGSSPMGMTSTTNLFANTNGGWDDLGQDPGPLQSAPVPYTDYLYPPSWNLERNIAHGAGLDQTQHTELMRELEMGGTDQLQSMIQAQNALFYPQGRTGV